MLKKNKAKKYISKKADVVNIFKVCNMITLKKKNNL